VPAGTAPRGYVPVLKKPIDERDLLDAIAQVTATRST
jgi:hypothetical protein